MPEKFGAAGERSRREYATQPGEKESCPSAIFVCSLMSATVHTDTHDSHLRLFTGNARHHRRGGWNELYRYAHVVRYQTYAGLKAEVSRTYLGIAWWLLEPTLGALTMHVVFGLLLNTGVPGAGSRKADFFPFLLVGTFAWQWFQNSVLLAANSIVLKAGVMQQVYLPKVIFPLVSVLNGTWKFLCTFAVMVVALWLLGYPPSVTYLALPIVMLVQFALNLAIGVPLSAWIPYFRDGITVIGASLGFLGMASGLFFRASQVPERYAPFINYNPLANLLTAYRTILLEGRWPDVWALTRVACTAAVLLAIGVAVMRRFDLKLTKVAQ